MPGVFVTASGTEVGKTYVTAGLIRAGRRAGLAMDALKPVMTGYDARDAEASDAGALLAALGRRVTPEAIARIAPWRFAPPLAPSMAAPLEGRAIPLDAVVDACRAAIRPDALTLIEGIGGVMVPLDARHTVLDLIAALALPVVLVSGTQLGALSHCLTAHAVLVARGAAPVLVVVDESAGATVSLDATAETLRGFLGDGVAALPRDAPDEAFDRWLARLRVDPVPRPSRASRSLA